MMLPEKGGSEATCPGLFVISRPRHIAVTVRSDVPAHLCIVIAACDLL